MQYVAYYITIAYFKLKLNKLCNILHIAMNKTDIGKIIRQRRKFLKITQKELSEIVGLGLHSLIDIESGKGNPTIDQLQKVVSAIGLDVYIGINQNE